MRKIILIAALVAVWPTAALSQEVLQQTAPLNLTAVAERDFQSVPTVRVSLGTFRSRWYREFTPELVAFKPADADAVVSLRLHLSPLRSPGRIVSATTREGEALTLGASSPDGFRCRGRNCYNRDTALFNIPGPALERLRAGTDAEVMVRTTDGDHDFVLTIPSRALAALEATEGSAFVK
ncbi:hypothetical protein [Brevundimonas sp.]|uniref:hypothetical protein n=1 Tax=Brevundimonas sp. TaxID=1871086 RepID=UPI002FC83625